MKHCIFFSMKFDNMKRIKAVAAALLQLLLLLVASGNAGALRKCGANRFYDGVARICTNCDDICDRRRGTPHLCQQHADDCSPREYIDENVIMELMVKTKCLPCLYFGLEACPVNKSVINSLEFVLNGIIRKIFRTRSNELDKDCLM